VELHDGSHIILKKLERDYDPTDRHKAMKFLLDARINDQFLTGLVYVNPNKKNFFDLLNLVDEPLVSLPENVTRPSSKVLDEIMERFA
jgi:2-oxoglutarate ferredoxin oxidoreductase subunit beta